MSIGGFSGDTRALAGSHGNYYAYFMSSNAAFTGSVYDGSSDTVPRLNVDLFSGIEASSKGYGLDLPPVLDGIDYSHAKQFYGHYQTCEHTGDRINLLPAEFCPARRAFMMDCVIAPSRETALHYGHIIERRKQQAGNAVNVARARAEFLPNLESVLIAKLHEHRRDALLVNGLGKTDFKCLDFSDEMLSFYQDSDNTFFDSTPVVPCMHSDLLHVWSLDENHDQVSYISDYFDRM
jgi:hypothetical protein